jgi:hypothetical protein
MGMESYNPWKARRYSGGKDGLFQGYRMRCEGASALWDYGYRRFYPYVGWSRSDRAETGNSAVSDATVVTRVLEHGGVVVGKAMCEARMPECSRNSID